MNRYQKIVRKEDAAALVSVLTIGTSVLLGTIALWNLTASLGLTNGFAADQGLFSNWMVWVMLAAVVRLGGVRLEQLLSQHTATVRTFRPVSVPERSRKAAA